MRWQRGLAWVCAAWVGGAASVHATAIGSSFEWHDLAFGFEVSSAGWLRSIETPLTATPGSLSAFVVGLATADLIGNPSTTYFDPPPGSLWETQACTTVAPAGFALSPCQQLPPATPAVQLDPGEFFKTSVNLFLPSAGIYWLYTRFPGDQTFANWDAYPAGSDPRGLVSTDLVATRSGFCTGLPGSCIDPDHLTFRETDAAATFPAFRMDFRPLAPVPEPETYAMWLLGAFVIGLALRRRDTSRAARIPCANASSNTE